MDWHEALRWNIEAAVGGALASLLLLGLFWLTLHDVFRPRAALRTFLEERLRPFTEHASILQLATISILAGIGEEALFRGALQAGLCARFGSGVALAVASMAFGVAHAVCSAYAVVATVIGGFLGLEYLATGSLWTPIVTHASYDFLALVYWLRIYRPPDRP